MIVRSKEDAVKLLLDRFTDKDSDYRFNNAVNGAAIGGFLGGTGAAMINRNKREIQEP